MLLSKLSTSILVVALGGDNVMVNTKVWDKVILWVLVHVFLELLVSSSLGLQTFWEVSTVASWDRLLLGKLSTGVLVIVLGTDDVVVDSEVWDKVIFWMFIHVFLELLVSCSLGT